MRMVGVSPDMVTLMSRMYPDSVGALLQMALHLVVVVQVEKSIQKSCFVVGSKCLLLLKMGVPYLNESV